MASSFSSKPELAVLIEHAGINNWHTLGVLLHLDPKKLDAIKSENHGVGERLLQMYSLWLTTNPNATYNDVIQALESKPLEEKVVAHNLKEYLQKGITI